MQSLPVDTFSLSLEQDSFPFSTLSSSFSEKPSTQLLKKKEELMLQRK